MNSRHVDYVYYKSVRSRLICSVHIFCCFRKATIFVGCISFILYALYTMYIFSACSRFLWLNLKSMGLNVFYSYLIPSQMRPIKTLVRPAAIILVARITYRIHNERRLYCQLLPLSYCTYKSTPPLRIIVAEMIKQQIGGRRNGLIRNSSRRLKKSSVKVSLQNQKQKT